MIPIGKVQTALRLEISVMIQPLRTPASNVEHDFLNIFSGLKSKKLAVTKKKNRAWGISCKCSVKSAVTTT